MSFQPRIEDELEEHQRAVSGLRARCIALATEVEVHQAAIARVRELHQSTHRDVGWRDEEGVEVYGEVEVCRVCVPRYSHFATRADVPTYPYPTIRALDDPMT